MGGSELEFVEWLRTQQREHPPANRRLAAVEVGIGDDMGVLAVDRQAGEAASGRRQTAGSRLLISSDMLLDGVHFDTKYHDLPLIGRKAMCCSLSDCAAMAVRPLAATVSVALPAHWSLADAQEVFRGVFSIADEYDVPIVGGDTTGWKHPLAIDVAITATLYEGIEPVRRSEAQPGDALFVTGLLGGSLLGRHLTFIPRVHEARKLAQALGDRLHAMIDISDGLSLDLWRMCQASKVGATLDEHYLEQVVSEDAKTASAADGRSPLDHALSDGEDYELLLAVSSDAITPFDVVPLHPLGRVTESGLWIRQSDGRTEPLEPEGYVH